MREAPLTVNALCERWGCSPTFVYTEMRKGRLPWAQIGKNRLVLMEDVLAYELTARRGSSPPASPATCEESPTSLSDQPAGDPTASSPRRMTQAAQKLRLRTSAQP